MSGFSGAGAQNHGAALRRIGRPLWWRGVYSLFPRVSHDEALKLGQTLCKSVRGLSIPMRLLKASKVVTASIGVATCIPNFKWHLELISLADKCLYKAKDAGRDKCVAEDKA